MTTRIPRSLLAGVSVIALAVAACGSSASSGPAGSPAGGSSPAAGASQNAGNAVGSGSCAIQITGDLQESWTTPQTASTLLLSQWLSASDRGMLAVSPGDEGMILNCGSDQGSIDLTSTAGTTTAMFPEAPGQYVIRAPGEGDAKPGQITMDINFQDGQLWRVATPGTFDVTSFGGGKFAGTFKAAANMMGADMTWGAKNVTISGTFDLSCTGSACS